MPTSAPSTSNYTLAKGVLSIADYGSSVFTDLGNATSAEIEINKEKLPHYSSRSGARSKDKEVVLEKDYMLNFVLDENSVENIALYCSGTHTGNAEIQALMEADDKEYILKFVSANAAGPDYTYTFHRVTIDANGASGLISEEWSELPFTAQGLEDTNNPSSPWFTVTADATTTTTSSSSTTTTTS